MATRTVDIACPVTFNHHSDPSKTGPLWQKWTKSFEIYLTAAAITDDNQKRALLLHCAGHDVQETFDTLSNTGTTYKQAVDALTGYFTPKTNIRYERHQFRQCYQLKDETMAQYVTRLRVLAKTCNFTDNDDAIIDQVIEKCESGKLRKTLLKDLELTLDKILSTAHLYESISHQSEQFERTKKNDHIDISEADDDYCNKLNYKMRKSNIAIPQKSSNNSNSNICYRCGSNKHLAHQCEVAMGKTCNTCGKLNHFSNVCRSSQTQLPSSTTSNSNNNRRLNRPRIANDYEKVKYVYAESSSDDEFVLTIDDKNKQPSFPINVNGHEIPMLVDSGSTVNIITRQFFDELIRLTTTITLSPYHRKVFAFGTNKPLEIDGFFNSQLSFNSICISAKVLVTPHGTTNILSRQSAQDLNLLRIGPQCNNIKLTENLVNKEILTKLDIQLETYKDRFEGLGLYSEVSLQIDNSITPVVQKHQRVPILMQQQLDKELDRLLEQTIIEPVNSPPTWVNPIIIVPKPKSDSIRLCVDMRIANTAIIRQPYQIPTIDELIHEFNGCTIFTKLDMNKGYHQLGLAPDSRDITTFATHRGLFRYTRLLYGASAAAELYQKCIEQVLAGIPLVRNISDDIIIGGKSPEDLLQRQEYVLQRLREKNITLNQSKCDFLKPSITYMGHVLSADGIAPDPRKLNTISSLKTPTNVKELRSFLGMITYCAKFLPHFATLTEPLRRLLKKKEAWNWSSEQEESFKTLKQLLLSTDILAYYNHEADTELITDASPVGLGAVLLQKQKDGSMRPIAYASRSLSPTEQRYSQIERESLAIFFGITRFRIYLYGIQFTVKTDHKPLVTIFSHSSKPPPRIENWIIKLMSYQYIVQYVPGDKNCADFLSRSNPLHHSEEVDTKTEKYVNLITSKTLPQAISKEDIVEATNADHTLQKLIKAVSLQKFPKDKDLKPYLSIQHDISTFEGLILVKNKILMPPSLQYKLLEVAHEGHQGITRTLKRINKTIWWPNIRKDVERYIQHCHGCQVTGPAPPHTPVEMTKIPPGAWLTVGCDLCGPFPTGETLIVCVDYYSRYPDVEIITKTKTPDIISKLRKLFCRFGAPQVLISDNGPQFIDSRFKNFMKEFNIKHRRVTPLHPMANGEVERFNRTIKKSILTAIADNKDWRETLDNFLLNYRNTPHATTGEAPARLMFGRLLKDKLPTMTTIEGKQNKSVITQDGKNKLKIKEYADKQRRAKQHNISVGQKALVMNNNKFRNKYSTRWNQTPKTVVGVKGNSILLAAGNKKPLLRSSCQVKTYYYSPKFTPYNYDSAESSESEYEIVDDTLKQSHNNTTSVNVSDNISKAAIHNNTDSDSDTIPYKYSSDEETSRNKIKRKIRIPPKYSDFQMEL